jgi:hypothetical protein
MLFYSACCYRLYLTDCTLHTVPYPTNALRTKHTRHTSTTTCFGTEIPSSGSDYNIGAEANLPIYWQAGRLSAICTGRLYPQECFLGVKAAWRIMSMKNSNCIIENRTRDLSACSAVPEAIASPRAPLYRQVAIKTYYFKIHIRSRSSGDDSILPAVIQKSNGRRNWVISASHCVLEEILVLLGFYVA